MNRNDGSGHWANRQLALIQALLLPGNLNLHLHFWMITERVQRYLFEADNLIQPSVISFRASWSILDHLLGLRALVQALLRPRVLAAAAEMEGHVDGFRRDRQLWDDMEMQAVAALHYAGVEATERNVAGAVEIMCKVSLVRWGARGG